MGGKTFGGDARRRAESAGVSPKSARRWGVLLAGGDGMRLRELTRFICGDERPKQFCPLMGERTLLEEARERAERSIDASRLLYSVTRTHESHYRRELADTGSHRIVQPSNRGTAPAVISALLHVFDRDEDAVVAFLPCDHYYSEERRFTEALDAAFAVAEGQRERVVLLGAEPDGPEVEYGWIELGGLVGETAASVYGVRGFQEKPPLPMAEHLFRSGSLWNTFVMVGHVAAFLEMTAQSVPGLMEVLRSGYRPAGGARETRIADGVYERITPTDFSRQVLTPGAKRLVAMGLGEVDWNDLGDPERVISTLVSRGAELPEWARRWRKSAARAVAAGGEAAAAVA